MILLNVDYINGNYIPQFEIVSFLCWNSDLQLDNISDSEVPVVHNFDA